MTNVGNGPSVTELARRIQRVEDKLDERIATTDMLRAQEKLFEARELGHVATIVALEARIKTLEEGNVRRDDGDRSSRRLVMVALLSGLINLLLVAITMLSKGTGTG